MTHPINETKLREEFMEKFEYKIIERLGTGDVAFAEKFLNDFGKSGWELVQIIEGKYVSFRFIFKRKKHENK